MLYNVKLTQFNLKFTQKNLYSTQNVVGGPTTFCVKTSKYAYLTFLCVNSPKIRTKNCKKRMKNSIYAKFTPNIRSWVWSHIVRIMRIMRNHRTGKRKFNNPWGLEAAGSIIIDSINFDCFLHVGTGRSFLCLVNFVSDERIMSSEDSCARLLHW